MSSCSPAPSDPTGSTLPPLDPPPRKLEKNYTETRKASNRLSVLATKQGILSSTENICGVDYPTLDLEISREKVVPDPRESPPPSPVSRIPLLHPKWASLGTPKDPCARTAMWTFILRSNLNVMFVREKLGPLRTYIRRTGTIRPRSLRLRMLRPRTIRPPVIYGRFYVPVCFIHERITINRTPPTQELVGHLA
jgi:hypothetical protein